MCKLCTNSAFVGLPFRSDIISRLGNDSAVQFVESFTEQYSRVFQPTLASKGAIGIEKADDQIFQGNVRIIETRRTSHRRTFP